MLTLGEIFGKKSVNIMKFISNLLPREQDYNAQKAYVGIHKQVRNIPNNPNNLPQDIS